MTNNWLELYIWIFVDKAQNIYWQNENPSSYKYTNADKLFLQTNQVLDRSTANENVK